MRIDYIHLKNYRCFDSLYVELHPHMTVLVAPNGQGKTSILDAIKVALWPYVAGFDLGSTTNDVTSIQIDDVRREQVQSHQIEWRIPAEIEATGQLRVRQLLQDGAIKKSRTPLPHLATFDVRGEAQEEILWQGKRYRDSIKKNSKTKNQPTTALDLGYVAQALQQRIFSGGQAMPDDLPMLGYYGTGRLWAQKKLTAAYEHVNGEASSRTFAYRDCLDPASSYKHFAQWYTDIFKSFRNAQIRNIEKLLPLDAEIPDGLTSPIRAVQLTIDEMLSNHTGWQRLEYSEEHKELVLYHELHGTLKISQLSDGIRNILALVGDIAYRCYKLNSHMGADAPQRTHGIVMIDEVDMHLHPSWQQTVLPDLKTAFPNLQFIVTTHSPQVTSSISSKSIRVLDQGRIFAATPGTEGAESSRLLKRLFGVELRPPLNQATKRLNEYLALVYADQWDTPRASRLRNLLNARYRGEEPALTAADLYIENWKWEQSAEGNWEEVR